MPFLLYFYLLLIFIMLLKLNCGIFKNLTAIAFIIVITLLYSCSGNEGKKDKQAENTTVTEKTQATGTEACSLITEEEAKAILGVPVKKGMITESMCQYIDASDKISESGNVSIQLNYGAGSGYDKYISDAENGFNAKAKPVTGVGDKAIFIAGQLIVLKGQNFFTVIVGKNISEAQVIDAEKTIAQKAIERMGN